jgi:raffinose/stachyose/melibiose transport system permease protein
VGIFRYTRLSLLREVAVITVGVVYCIPLIIMVLLSLKSNKDVILDPLGFPTNPDFSNYKKAWSGTSQMSLGQALFNSLVITVASVGIVIILSSMAAYALARRTSRWSTGLYLLFVSGIIVPFQLGVIPLYSAMRKLHLVGTTVGMVLLYVGLLMPLAVFLYAGFIRTLPREYEEAAQVDGAGLLRTFFRIVFPLLRPITGTVAVLAALFTWNEFFLPLIFLGGTKSEPLPVAIYAFVGEFTSQWNLICAAVGISVLPMLIFFLIAQKQLIRGFAGGIRG